MPSLKLDLPDFLQVPDRTDNRTVGFKANEVPLPSPKSIWALVYQQYLARIYDGQTRHGYTSQEGKDAIVFGESRDSINPSLPMWESRKFPAVECETEINPALNVSKAGA